MKKVQRAAIWLRRAWLYGIGSSLKLIYLKTAKKTADYARCLQRIRERLWRQEKAKKDLELIFQLHTGRKELDWENPLTFCEKMQWMKLHDVTPIKTLMADKYRAKEWIDNKLGRPYAVPLLGVWDSFDDIDFDALPEQFALKVNGGCRWNMIVRDKSKLDRTAAKELFEKWLKLDLGFVLPYEFHHFQIKPVILAEKCLPPFLNGSNEYKFMCFGGRVEAIYVFERAEIGGKPEVTTTLYSRGWDKLDWQIDTDCPTNPVKAPRPETLDEMIRVAEKLSEDVAFVRVDLYDVDGIVYVGELTLIPGGGVSHFTSYAHDLALGEKLMLPDPSPLPEALVQKYHVKY